MTQSPEYIPLFQNEVRTLLPLYTELYDLIFSYLQPCDILINASNKCGPPFTYNVGSKIVNCYQYCQKDCQKNSSDEVQWIRALGQPPESLQLQIPEYRGILTLTENENLNIMKYGNFSFSAPNHYIILDIQGERSTGSLSKIQYIRSERPQKIDLLTMIPIGGRAIVGRQIPNPYKINIDNWTRIICEELRNKPLVGIVYNLFYSTKIDPKLINAPYIDPKNGNTSFIKIDKYAFFTDNPYFQKLLDSDKIEVSIIIIENSLIVRIKYVDTWTNE